MGSLAQLQCAALLLCVPISGALGDTCAFSMDSNRSHHEKISRNHGLFRLQLLSSSGKLTAPQSIKQAPHHLDLSACCLYVPPTTTFTGLFPFFPQNPAWLTCLTLLQVLPLSTVTPVSFIFLKIIYFVFIFFFNWSWFIMLYVSDIQQKWFYYT